MKRIAPRHVALGVVLCGIGVALYLAAQPRQRAQQTKNCAGNLKWISLSMMQYARDYDEHYPRAANWMDALQSYARGFGPGPATDAAVEARYRCPTTGSFYAYNANLATNDFALTVPQTVWIFETMTNQNRRNLSDKGALWPVVPIHQRHSIWGNNVLNGDGSVKLVAQKPAASAFTLQLHAR